MAINADSFVKRFAEECLNEYGLKVDKHDPLMALVALMSMSARQISEDYQVQSKLNERSLNALAAQFKQREDEFIDYHFKQLELWERGITSNLEKKFFESVVKAYEEITRKHMFEMKNEFDNHLMKVKKAGIWAFVASITCSLLSCVLVLGYLIFFW